jgi:hypothetical protein
LNRLIAVLVLFFPFLVFYSNSSKDFEIPKPVELLNLGVGPIVGNHVIWLAKCNSNTRAGN